MIDISSIEFQLFMKVFLFLFGLCVGSFLNVIIYRLPEEKSIVFPNSACTDCNEKLRSIDMIPILSYIFLGGKCRYCKKPISIQYPLIELFTGLVWLFTYIKFGFSIETVAIIFLYTLLIPVAIIDLNHMIIPNGLVLTGFIGGLLLSAYHIFFEPISIYRSTAWYAPFIGMISSSGILFIIALLSFIKYRDDGGMGMGDVKLFIPIGMILGWKLSLLSLFLSIMIGGIISIILLIFKVLNKKSALPFGPFIVISTFLCGFFGNNIIDWYVHSFL
jgi:leader peptidase (prepilin peptidase)/N-methyltransferase